MPIIKIDNREIHCKVGQNLRQVLLDADFPLYNNNAKLFNCRGLGTCGTCAVEVIGKVLPSKPAFIESTRIAILAPKDISNLRLACYCALSEDIEVIKHAGYWGEVRISQP